MVETRLQGRYQVHSLRCLRFILFHLGYTDSHRSSEAFVTAWDRTAGATAEASGMVTLHSEECLAGDFLVTGSTL